jgi:DNA-binding NarL/FixJ family response regulator
MTDTDDTKDLGVAIVLLDKLVEETLPNANTYKTFGEALLGDDPNGRLRRLWAYAHATGLSAQETRVLEALVEGEDPATIAGRHQVAMATVRSQIRGVLAKAGVNGMRELLAQVMRVLR